MAYKWKFISLYKAFIFILMFLFLWKSYPESTVMSRNSRENFANSYSTENATNFTVGDENPGDTKIEMKKSVFYDSEDNETESSTTNNEETDHKSIWNKWEATQNKRRDAIKDACGGMLQKDEKYKSLLASRGSIGHLLVDDVHKALYCFIPKVGYTTWEKMWMILTGLSNAKDISEIEDNTPQTLLGKMMLFSQDLSDEDLQHKLESYMKVIVVRHPFQRLLSSYFDKISTEHGKLPDQKVVLSYIQQFRKDANHTNITWHEYIDFINSLSSLRDSHWQSYEKLCHPCDVDYDIIVQFDTFSEDSEMFLRLIKAPSDLHFPNRTSRVDYSVMDHYMKQLSGEQVNRLHNYYKKDFELFQYNI